MSAKLQVLALILLSVGLNAAAQLFLRAAMRNGIPSDTLSGVALDVALRPGIIGGLICYGLSLLTWIYVLSRTEASFAYPFLGLGFAFVAVASAFILGEAMTVRKVLGTIIITAGVVVLAGNP